MGSPSFAPLAITGQASQIRWKDARDMMTTDLGACEWFVWDLRRSNLIDRGQLDQVIGEFLSKNPGAEPQALSEFLIGQGILTEFQAERLLQGKTQGFVLGPFTLTDALGSGSMGTVYKAQSKTDSKLYAVKVLPRRSMWNVRIARRKVRAFDQCKHPAVIPFVDVGTAGGMHYLAWPLVEGTSLDKVVEQQGKLSADVVARFAYETAQGLEQAHAADLFHGLLKPSNIMISPEGQVRILDFGIGCLLAETEGESLVDTMSTANSVNSGLDCSSPESIMDPTNLTPVGDQYSLGCVMYFCLTGQYPFPDGTAVEKMMAHQHKQPTDILDLNPDVPRELVDVIEKLMEKQPTMRYVNCSEVIEALKPFLSAEEGAPARRPMAMPRGAPLKTPAAPAPADPNQAGKAPPSPPQAPTHDEEQKRQPIPPRVGSGHLPPRAPSALAANRPAPKPAGLRPSAQGLPPRPSAQGLPPKTVPAPARQPGPVAKEAIEESPAAAPSPAVQAQAVAGPKRTLGEKMGNLGIILLSMLFGVIAFIVSSMIKF